MARNSYSDRFNIIKYVKVGDARLPNKLPRIRIISIHRLGHLARTMSWSRSRMGSSLRARSAAERC